MVRTCFPEGFKYYFGGLDHGAKRSHAVLIVFANIHGIQAVSYHGTPAEGLEERLS